MAKERWLLPVKCKSCGRVFDLWHDLQEQEQLRSRASGEQIVSFEKRFASLLQQQSLCWTCRKIQAMKISRSEDNYDDTAEFEMEVEFE